MDERAACMQQALGLVDRFLAPTEFARARAVESGVPPADIAVLTRVKDRWRWHVLSKCFTQKSFDQAMTQVPAIDDLSTQSLRVTLDVDPMSML